MRNFIARIVLLIFPTLIFATVLDVGTIWIEPYIQVRGAFPRQVRVIGEVENFGDTTVTFPVTLKIDEIPIDTQIIQNLEPNQAAYVSFAWTVSGFGYYSASCSTNLEGDIHPENDRLIDTIYVGPPDIVIVAIISPNGEVPLGCIVFPSIEI